MVKKKKLTDQEKEKQRKKIITHKNYNTCLEKRKKENEKGGERKGLVRFRYAYVSAPLDSYSKFSAGQFLVAREGIWCGEGVIKICLG